MPFVFARIRMSSRCITTCRKTVRDCSFGWRNVCRRADLLGVFVLLALTVPVEAARVVGPDSQLRQALIGTWEIDLSARNHFPLRKAFATYRSDGGFQQVVLGEIAGIAVRIDVAGRWSVQNGVLTETITKTLASSAVGKSQSSTLVSLKPNEVVLADKEKERLILIRSRLPKNLPPVSHLMSEMVQSAELKKLYAVYTPQPKYPYSSFRNNREGPGIFRLVVKQDGNVERVVIVRSTGDGDLDQAATTALLHWRFKPGKVKSLVTPVIFTMHPL
jgi:TonB family protein